MQQEKFEKLRQKAEEMIRNKPPEQTAEQTEMAELLHELAVHQVELEMQNEELRDTQHKLQDSKNNYFDLYEYAPVGYLNMNAKGVIKSINLAATKMFGRQRNELLHRMITEFIRKEYRDVFFRHLDKVLISVDSVSGELALDRPDEKFMQVRIESLYPGISYEGEKTVRMAMVDITELNKARQKLYSLNAELEQKMDQRSSLANQRLEQMKKLNFDLIRAEQRQRQRLAETLHENLQQLLVGAQFSLSAARGSDDPAAMRDYMARTEETLKNAIDVSRSLSHELYPPLLYQSGLKAALTWYAAQVKKLHGLNVQLDVPSFTERFGMDIEIFLFQCARELLLNTVKHGKATASRLSLNYVDGDIVLQAADKGVGFDCRAYMEQSELRGGLGLTDIKQRIELMGGQMEIVSEKGGGCTVTLRLPSTPQARREAAIETGPQTKEAAAKSKEPSPIRVMLADDHEILRRGLVRLLEKQEDIEIVAEAEDGLGAIENARRTQPDVILMDIGMPMMDGIEATERILKENPATRVIALTLHEEEWMVSRTLEAGACRYLSKTVPPEQLVEAIRDAAQLEKAS